MMNDYKFKDQQVINFDNGINKGIGRILGCASTEMAAVGRFYIVQDKSKTIRSKDYPFECFVCAECHLSVYYPE